MKKIMWLILCVCQPVWSQSYTALKTADTVDDNVGDGICADADGQCSLRAALMEANANPNHNTISLVRGNTYKITRPNTQNLDSDGDFDITENVTIQIINTQTPIQSVAELPTIDANGLDRVFHIDGADFVTFYGLRIINGDATTAGYSGGGGIMVEPGVQIFTLDRSVLEMNQGTAGAALRLMGEATYVQNSDLSLNSSTSLGGNVTGNAIHHGAGDLYVYRSSIHHNHRSDGQNSCVFAIHTDFSAQELTVMNTTIAHNGGSQTGECVGGITMLNSTATLNGVTLYGNSGRGLNYYDDPNDGQVHAFKMRNSLLSSGNSSCNFPAGNIDTGDAVSGHNISDDASCAFSETNGNGNLNNTTLGLHPGRGLLPGGYFWYQEPMPGSMSLDNGSPLALAENDDEACSPTDQNGFQRDHDGDNNQIGRCDSGATEYNGDLLFYSSLE